MNCAACGHDRFHHFWVDEHGHEEQTRCAFYYGSGRFRCNCTGWMEVTERGA